MKTFELTTCFYVSNWKRTKYSKDCSFEQKRWGLEEHQVTQDSDLKPPLPTPQFHETEEHPWAIPAGDEVVILDSASGPSPTSFTAAIENLFQKQRGEMCSHGMV